MINKMKYTFSSIAILLVVSLFLTNCRHNPDDIYQSTGVITGPDYRMCACCGGYFITIDTNTYDFDTVPSNSGINLQQDTFPIDVELDWQMNTVTACTGRIVINRIKRLNN